jgi:predicted metal-dependent peptidase
MSYAVERKARMERLERIWISFAKREVIIALKSINVMIVQWDERIPTACVGFGRNASKPVFKFNPQFFDSLSDDEIAFVIAHETAHMVLQHLIQLKQNPEYKEKFKVFNVAADCIINDWLDKCKYPEGPWFYGKKFFCPACNGKGCSTNPNCKGAECKACAAGACNTSQGCIGDNCSDRTLSEVFRKALKRFEEEGMQTGPGPVGQCTHQPCDGQSSSQSGAPCPDCRNQYGEMGGEMVDEHGEWDKQDNQAAKDWIKDNVNDSFKEGLNNADKSYIDQDTEVRTADTDGYKDNAYTERAGDAKDTAQNFTTSPGNIVGEGCMWDIDHLTKVRANWRAILTEGSSMKEKIETSWRMNPNVLLASNSKYRLPRDEDRPTLKVLVALDVSGSVSEGDKRLFIDCWRGIPRNTFEVRGVVFANRCAEIKMQKNIDSKNFQHDYVGGGTEFSAITDWIKTSNYEPDKVVVITDAGSYWRYQVKHPHKFCFVIRNGCYERNDGTVDAKQCINEWHRYQDDKTDWMKAKFFSFSKFAKILSNE